jgi:hypothetical protein
VAIERALAELLELSLRQHHLVNETYSLLTKSDLDRLPDTVESIAVAQAEATVYLNRSIGELRRVVESYVAAMNSDKASTLG